jgi:hypothetical protein
MKKLLKFLLWTFVGVLALVLVLVLTIPLWLGPTVATVATKVTPDFTGTPFVLEGASINPYTGKFSITKLTLGNPEGYPVPTAFSVSNVTVDVEMSSLFSDTIHIREITIIDPYASYVSNDDGTNNFEWIMAHVNEKLGPKEETEEKEEKEEEKGAGKKVVIDKLTIAGTRVKLKILPEMPIPTITLTDIGKESNGATWEEVGQMLADSFMKATSAIGDGLTSALGALGDGANSLMGGATNVLGGAASAIGGATTNILGGAKDLLGGASTNVMGGASEALGGATKAIGDTAKKLGNLGGLLGGDDESKASETNKASEAEKPASSGVTGAVESASKGVLDTGKSIGNGALDAGKSIGEGLKKLNPFGN